MAVRAVAIVGPTASGKSQLAVELAELLGDAEIISVDSMCVYRGMDIGTATPTEKLTSRVPHHLIDVVDPDEEWSVAEFQRHATVLREDFAATGRRAIFVGGTGLYHRAVVDRLSIPGRFPEVAAVLDGEPDTSVLAARLAALDPVAAARIEVTNRRRLIRALEVTIGAGRPFSDFGPGLEIYGPSDVTTIGLAVPRGQLAGRIDVRLSAQVADGFVDEVQRLLDRVPRWSRTAAQALGYREIADALRSSTSIDDALELTRRRTRRFAVRQERWFRRDPRIEWVDAETRPTAEQVASTLERVWNR